MKLAKDGWCAWITGLPGCGKSVVSETLLSLLNQADVPAQLLSSDALRKVLTPQPTYSLDERNVVYNTLVYIASLLTQNNTNVVIDATGNLRSYRENARKQIPRFTEVYLNCTLKACIKREVSREKTYLAPKRIYARAKEGQTSTVPGVGQPYEPPLKPEITLDTTLQDPMECAKEILQFILERYSQGSVRRSLM